MNNCSNEPTDPELRGMERGTTGTGQLDPRPEDISIAVSPASADYPDGPFFTPVNFNGAFGRTNWTRGWTALDNLGYNGDIVVAIEEVRNELRTGVSLHQKFQHTFNPVTCIAIGIERAQRVRLAIYDALRRQVRLLCEGTTNAGPIQALFYARNLASGVFLYRLESEDDCIARRMTLVI